MRINEIDSKHKEFKDIILDHDLTEEQLDEIIPAVIGAIGGTAARALGGTALKGIARGVAGRIGTGLAGAGAIAGGLARGVGSAVGGVASGVGKAVGGAVGGLAQGLSSAGNNTQSNTSSGTIGTNKTQGTQKTNLQRGQQLTIPSVDPKNPKKVTPTTMKVKNVTGREVELEPSKKTPGQPNTVKFNKKDLQLQ